jgi:NAD(P)-dependent dehydrogenase (short-subunit alcohol dehydrogenase family)
MSELGLAAGKVALVTGGNSGIGRATALFFAEEGAEAVIVSGRNEATAAETVSLIEARGTKALAMIGDVGDPSTSEAWVAAALSTFGRLDCAVNNAAVDGPIKPIEDYTNEEWRTIIRTNCDGVFYGMRAQVQAMSATGGAIVNVSSGAAISYPANMAAYTTSKLGILGMTRSVAGEYVDKGIRINAVLPGPTRTTMFEEHVDTEQGKRQIARLPMGRVGEPSEIAEAIVWLCSPRSSYITGVCLPVDGGLHSFWR